MTGGRRENRNSNNLKEGIYVTNCFRALKFGSCVENL
jgi:hypothetical protein